MYMYLVSLMQKLQILPIIPFVGSLVLSTVVMNVSSEQCMWLSVLIVWGLLLVHTCPLTGEFGIVYKAQLVEMGTQPSLKTVAVKTLKGLEISQYRWIDKHSKVLQMTLNLFLSKWLCCLGFFDQNEINKLMEESVKMKQFNHPNVMNLIGVCLNAGPAPYIVMPFMANGSLLSYLRKERPNLLLDETADEDLVRIRAAKGIGGAQGKYKKWDP